MGWFDRIIERKVKEVNLIEYNRKMKLLIEENSDQSLLDRYEGNLEIYKYSIVDKYGYPEIIKGEKIYSGKPEITPSMVIYDGYKGNTMKLYETKIKYSHDLLDLLFVLDNGKSFINTFTYASFGYPDDYENILSSHYITLNYTSKSKEEVEKENSINTYPNIIYNYKKPQCCHCCKCN